MEGELSDEVPLGIVGGEHPLYRRQRHQGADLTVHEVLDLAATGRCKDYPEQMKGVAISIAGGIQKELQEVYRDKRLPASRGCVVGYRIAGVVEAPVNDTGLSVVLIHTLTRGFEGLDASFMAVPVRLPSWR